MERNFDDKLMHIQYYIGIKKIMHNITNPQFNTTQISNDVYINILYNHLIFMNEKLYNIM